MSIPFDISEAFDALYDDVILVRGTRQGGRTLSQSVQACVFEDSDAEPVADDSMASEARTISVSFRDGEWAHYGERLRQGDALGFDGTTFRVVSSRRDFVLGWTVKAREVA